MKLIAQSFKGNYKEIVLGPLFKLLEAVLELFVPLVMATIIDVGIKNGDVRYIAQRGLVMVGLAVLGVAASMVCQYYAAKAAAQFGSRLRGRVFHHVMNLSSDEVGTLGEGRLITRLTNDTNQVQNGLNMVIRLATRGPFLAVGSVVMAMLLNFRIGLVFLISTPLIVLVLFFIMRRTVPSYEKIQAGQDNLAGLAGENLAGARVIRAFSRQKPQQQEFDAAADELTEQIVKVGRISSALNPITTFIVNIAIICIVWLGARFVFRGEAAPGEIIALVSYMGQTLLALVVAANLIVLFTRSLASARRVAAVLATEPSIKDGPGAEAVPGAPVVEFQNVHFSYHAGSDDALEDISFAVQPGQTVGIIGGTGSGKSTIVNLIMRYYDVGSGRVLVDGADVRQYKLRSLRGRVGLVPQRAALFSGSVRRNLQFGDTGASDETLWQALEAAQGKDFVEKMPEGLDTTIEEGGKNLSGGQKQRLTIARALVRRPEILILDDAASALDYATDAALRKALTALGGKSGVDSVEGGNSSTNRTEAGKAGATNVQTSEKVPGSAAGGKRNLLHRDDGKVMTVIIVSQRVASIRTADNILVMDDGRLAGAGTHEELLAANEVYREIYASQNR